MTYLTHKPQELKPLSYFHKRFWALTTYSINLANKFMKCHLCEYRIPSIFLFPARFLFRPWTCVDVLAALSSLSMPSDSVPKRTWIIMNIFKKMVNSLQTDHILTKACITRQKMDPFEKCFCSHFIARIKLLVSYS